MSKKITNKPTKNKHVNCVVVTMVLGMKCNSSASHLLSSVTFCRFSLQIWFEFSFVQRRHRIGAFGKGSEENHWVRRHAIIQSITTAYMLWMQIIRGPSQGLAIHKRPEATNTSDEPALLGI